MSHQTHIHELEAELAQAKRDSEPVISEVIEDTREKKVTKISTGTIRTDLKGGAPLEYSRSHQRIINEAPMGLPVMSKEHGKVLEDNDTQRTAKLKTGSVRVDLK